MKQCKIKFRFTYLDNSIMETTHIGKPCETKDDAEAKAWQAMGEDNFKRQLILTTKKIEKIEVEFLKA